MTRRRLTALLQLVLAVLMANALYACGKKGAVTDEGPGSSSVTADDDGQPHPAGSFDYASIAPHPRLLFSTQDEAALQGRLQTDTDLMAIHEALIRQCDDMLNTAPVTRILEGKRMLSVSRTALKRIFYLAYAYRMVGDERYLKRAERELVAVCGFTDWNPAHFLDVGEMAMAVAIGYDWLFEGLPEDTRHKIRIALRDKAFAPARNPQYNWYLGRSNNWNQVCNAGIAFAALATYEANKRMAVDHLEQVMETIRLPLQAYAPDGNYPEGYMYWSYGTSFQVLLLAALEQSFGTDNGLHRSEGFLATQAYMSFMVGPSGKSFNYSDSYGTASPNPALLWLAQKSDDTGVLYPELQLMKGGGAYVRSFGEDRLLPTALIYANKLRLADGRLPSRKLWVGHGLTPVAIVRTGWQSPTDKYVGIKGGKADTDHGHMDAGSFIYESQGIRWALDLGYQNYFSLESKGVDLWNMGQQSPRWDVFRLGHLSHNVLTVDGMRHVASGKAIIDRVFDTDAKRGALVDLTETFRGALNSASREVVLIDEEYLVITDRVTTNYKGASIRWAMATGASPELIGDDRIRLSQEGKEITLTVAGISAPQLKTWSTEPANDYDASNPGTVMVGFKAELEPDRTYEFTVTLRH